MTEFLEDRKSSSEKRKRKNRRRNITWFNPPYSQNVSTNIGRRFRTLISKHFPRNSNLSKSSTSIRWSWVTVVCPIWQLWSVNTIARSFGVGRLLAKIMQVGGHVTAASRWTARWTEHAKYGQWCTRQPSRRRARRGITLVWPRKPSSSVIMRTSILWGTTDTATARHCRSTSGPWKMNKSATTSSGACFEKPKSTRTLPKGVTWAWLRS